MLFNSFVLFLDTSNAINSMKLEQLMIIYLALNGRRFHVIILYILQYHSYSPQRNKHSFPLGYVIIFLQSTNILRFHI
jgi:hypothetical protein